MNNSNKYYDAIANQYRHISNIRIEYLNSVNKLIVDNIGEADSYVDIGAGDGVRSLYIAQKVKAKSVVLIDNSEQLLANVNRIDGIELINTSILDMVVEKKYALVTCLWNVLGHIGGYVERKTTLLKFKELLKDNGRIVIDVNNRYNISTYGNKNVMTNIVKDMNQDPTAGWFSLSATDIETKVYIHAPLEIDRLCEEIDLDIDMIFYVDYDSGELKETFFEGQLLYFLKRKGVVAE